MDKDETKSLWFIEKILKKRKRNKKNCNIMCPGKDSISDLTVGFGHQIGVVGWCDGAG